MRLLLVTLLLLPTLVWAHKSSDSYLSLSNDGQSTAISGQWDVALRDLQLVVPLDANGDRAITWGELRHQKQTLIDTLLPTLSVTALHQGQRYPCTLHSGQLQVDEHVDGHYAVLHLHGQCGAVPDAMEVSYRFLFSRDPSHQGLLRLQLHKQTLSAIFSNTHRTQQLTVSGTSRWQAFQGFVRQGIHHILIGYDHILFLLTLLFPAVLVWKRGGWRPARSMGKALRETLAVVSAFTLTHSISLALATLGLVTLPSWLVESGIALTVAIGGAANLMPRLFPRRWLMALAFGLIHGLGFASVLADLGLQGMGLVVPLLGFNLGVEIGQALIVLLFVPSAFALRRTRGYRQVFVPVASLVIMVLAGIWLVQRLEGSPFF
ncbi:MAG: HupE/UreJ family protein [Alcanivorax sp.]|nr:HupE/UreJ family protein [Alcanivorax sp.]